jgi:NTP pyrophosphatase (non-canonical NTP hydrolase)
MSITMTPDIHTGLTQLQELCGSTAASKGFHDDRPFSDTTADRRDLANWQGNKLLLIVSEVIEAHDEIRSGHAADETYYPVKGTPDADLGVKFSLVPSKPEGVPSEIADAVIRCFDFAYTEGFSLADIILEKLQFNAQRPYKHGRSF